MKVQTSVVPEELQVLRAMALEAVWRGARELPQDTWELARGFIRGAMRELGYDVRAKARKPGDQIVRLAVQEW